MNNVVILGISLLAGFGKHQNCTHRNRPTMSLLNVLFLCTGTAVYTYFKTRNREVHARAMDEEQLVKVFEELRRETALREREIREQIRS